MLIANLGAFQTSQPSARKRAVLNRITICEATFKHDGLKDPATEKSALSENSAD